MEEVLPRSELSVIQITQREIHDKRIENPDRQFFICAKDLRDILSKARVKEILKNYVGSQNRVEVTQYVADEAWKTLGILICIGHVSQINQFIKHDQMQERRFDDALPLSRSRIQEILDDRYISDKFYELQWEFCAPLFRGKRVPRVLDDRAVLPFLDSKPLSSGRYGSVYQVDIHPYHRPPNYENTAKFVRKELEFNDETYGNEVHVLSSLQQLHHPNILKLVSCYTYKAKHNLISPYISGGTLKSFLQSPRPDNFTYAEMLYSITGLASALWTLHVLALDDTIPTHKGQHQDLHHDNILVDGIEFILADFGLSKIKPLSGQSRTPFKGRKGYCQAPECADLGPPYEEHKTTRATDVFALACMFADILVYLVRGPSGVAAFTKAREFDIGPMCYRLYHKQYSSNSSVVQWLQDVASELTADSMSDLVSLLGDMLEISPGKRPSAAKATTKLCMITAQAFMELFNKKFDSFKSCADARVEQARLESWLWNQDFGFYSTPNSAQATVDIFRGTVRILRHIDHELEGIRTSAFPLDSRSFLGIRTSITQLLNGLSAERRASAQSRLHSIILAEMDSEITGNIFTSIKASYANSQLDRIVLTKHMVAQVQDPTKSSNEAKFSIFKGSLSYVRQSDRYKVADASLSKGSGHSKRSKQIVIVESIPFQHQYQRNRLWPRIVALCNLLSSSDVSQVLRIPPFFALHENDNEGCWDILYSLPKDQADGTPRNLPVSLHELLIGSEPKFWPSLGKRYKLALMLAEVLAAFHDFGWYHEDLTSTGVLFFTTDKASMPFPSLSPYLIGFRHSRQAVDTMTEGPLRSRSHQRYHHPKYVDIQNHQFKTFHPGFDIYSLGVILIEIGLWTSISEIMEKHKSQDNSNFSQAMIAECIPKLAFSMGDPYADAVKSCLVDVNEESYGEDGKMTGAASILQFKQRVVVPLQRIAEGNIESRNDKKRKRGSVDESSLPSAQRRSAPIASR